MRLIDAIAAGMQESPVIERDVFGSEEPALAASAIERFCVEHLGAEVAECLFFVSSIGCVTGVVLHDGRRVVVKAHQPDKSEARLRACQSVQRVLADRGFPAPRPLLPPTPLGRGLAVVEAYLREGEIGDGHEPAVRRALAAGFATLVGTIRPSELSEALPGAWFSTLGPRLWPRPHNALFDFEATARGAEWIDALAARARAVPLAGEAVVAHFDWRIEHVLLREGRIATVYDWDSLHLEREPVAVGAAASAFTARWDLDPPREPVPSLDEKRAFVAEYEQARGRPFTRAERAVLWASCAYSTAYIARCQHALDPEQKGTGEWGTFRAVLREQGEAMLAEAR
jgi:hypothetical protein